MNEVFENIYNAMSLASLPGIVAFQVTTARPESLEHARRYYFGSGMDVTEYEESLGAGSLDQD